MDQLGRRRFMQGAALGALAFTVGGAVTSLVLIGRLRKDGASYLSPLAGRGRPPSEAKAGG